MPGAGENKPLEWSARSLRDLLLIQAFYSQFGAATAERVASAILDSASLLERHPRIGARGKRPGARDAPASSYFDERPAGEREPVVEEAGTTQTGQPAP